MTDIDALIDRLIALPEITPELVGAVVGVQFALDRENPYFRFFEGLGRGRLKSAELSISRGTAKRSIALNFNIDDPCYKESIELSRYGEVVGIQMFPDTRPEGGVAFTYRYGEYSLVFTFTSNTNRLERISIAK